MAARRFFATPAAFRRWLATNHAKRTELWVGFHRKGSGKRSLTWPESVDEALCFGWIDGLRRSIDAESYEIRFTPRKRVSTWSAVNVARYEALEREGRMTDAGRAAHAHRTAARTGIYAHERKLAATLSPAQEKTFREDREAWAWFAARPPGYRATATHWVVSAKREPTRARRLGILIDCSRRGVPIPQLARR